MYRFPESTKHQRSTGSPGPGQWHCRRRAHQHKHEPRGPIPPGLDCPSQASSPLSLGIPLRAQSPQVVCGHCTLRSQKVTTKPAEMVPHRLAGEEAEVWATAHWTSTLRHLPWAGLPTTGERRLWGWGSRGGEGRGGRMWGAVGWYHRCLCPSSTPLQTCLCFQPSPHLPHLPPLQETTHPLPYLKQVAFLCDSHSVPSLTHMGQRLLSCCLNQAQHCT